MELLLLCIKIFFVRITDVSLGTVRTIVMVKGHNVRAALIGFCEVFIWFLVVREALNTDSTSLWVAISYAGGFAAGTLIGGILSNLFVNGNLTLQIILSSQDDNVVDEIRKKGYAVSVIDAKGMNEEDKYMLFMEINKKKLPTVRKTLKELDDKAFIVINETKMVQNGYFK